MNVRSSRRSAMSNTTISRTTTVALIPLLFYFCCLWIPVHGFNVNPVVTQQLFTSGSSINSNGRRLILLRMSDPNPNSSSSESETSRLSTTTTTTTSEQESRPARPIEKTDEEWKETLTPDQYYILRKEGTETPGASILNNISVIKNGADDEGTFCCAGCNNPLFLADTKFDSGTGWPSFYSPVTSSAVDLITDFKLIVPRTECVCSKCGGHLGHVFEDGPEPTGQRYCMNGAAMQFYRDTERPELAAEVSKMASEDPFKLSPTQALPGALINVLIGGLFFQRIFVQWKKHPHRVPYLATGNLLRIFSGKINQ